MLNHSRFGNMHPRNVLRVPPDYTKLAIKHKSFREICKLELTGKVSVNFREERSLRELTKMLLLEYFDLQVEFAPGSLVPTLPLRLNYLLWLEDLLAPLKLSTVRGIDIGCGSSCIYSILAAKKNKWHMLALESADANISYARENVKRNDLESLVEVYAQPDCRSIFKSYFDAHPDSEQFHFCLCNPPFFDSKAEKPFGANTRKPERPAPSNAHTGRVDELTCEGGEVQFIRSIIDESQGYKQRVHVFSTMVGVKANVPKLLRYLGELHIKNVCQTEFQQGHTTRWGIAWSYQQAPLGQVAK